MKNHKIIDGRLLQTNKKFSALKEFQKTKIAEWEYEAYKDCYLKFKKIPDKRRVDDILFSVFEKIEAAEIWIPEDEIYKHYQSKITCRFLVEKRTVYLWQCPLTKPSR